MIRNYFIFLWNSKNQYGVHSPFVFNLVTKCFYNKASFAEYSELIPIQKSNFKKAKLILRIVAYFKSEQVLTIGKPSSSVALALHLGNQNGNHTFAETTSFLKQILKEKSTFDFVYFETNNKQTPFLEVFELLISTAQSNSVWIINDIYSNSDTQECWKIIKNHPKVTVTIDIFAFGLVFFRTEQQKEQFTIRT